MFLLYQPRTLRQPDMHTALPYQAVIKRLINIRASSSPSRDTTQRLLYVTPRTSTTHAHGTPHSNTLKYIFPFPWLYNGRDLSPQPATTLRDSRSGVLAGSGSRGGDHFMMHGTLIQLNRRLPSHGHGASCKAYASAAYHPFGLTGASCAQSVCTRSAVYHPLGLTGASCSHAHVMPRYMCFSRA